ncbi:hypothetical protein HDU96_004051, partial [Phlyctochytrium bullatum]
MQAPSLADGTTDAPAFLLPTCALESENRRRWDGHLAETMARMALNAETDPLKSILGSASYQQDGSGSFTSNVAWAF